MIISWYFEKKERLRWNMFIFSKVDVVRIFLPLEMRHNQWLFFQILLGLFGQNSWEWSMWILQLWTIKLLISNLYEVCTFVVHFCFDIGRLRLVLFQLLVSSYSTFTTPYSPFGFNWSTCCACSLTWLWVCALF